MDYAYIITFTSTAGFAMLGSYKSNGPATTNVMLSQPQRRNIWGADSHRTTTFDLLKWIGLTATHGYHLTGYV